MSLIPFRLAYVTFFSSFSSIGASSVYGSLYITEYRSKCFGPVFDILFHFIILGPIQHTFHVPNASNNLLLFNFLCTVNCRCCYFWIKVKFVCFVSVLSFSLFFRFSQRSSIRVFNVFRKCRTSGCLFATMRSHIDKKAREEHNKALRTPARSSGGSYFITHHHHHHHKVFRTQFYCLDGQTYVCETLLDPVLCLYTKKLSDYFKGLPGA